MDIPHPCFARELSACLSHIGVPLQSLGTRGPSPSDTQRLKYNDVSWARIPPSVGESWERETSRLPNAPQSSLDLELLGGNKLGGAGWAGLTPPRWGADPRERDRTDPAGNRHWKKMAGTSSGARFYRQIKRHPGVSSAPDPRFPLTTPPLKTPKPCLLYSFPNAPKSSQGHPTLCLCCISIPLESTLGQLM